jgi:cytochrome P450
MRYIIVGGHEAMLELMRHRPDKARRAQSFGPLVQDGIDGVLTAEGKFWRAQRRVISPAFSPGKMDGYLPAMKTVARRLVRKWQGGPGMERGNGAATVQPVTDDMSCLTADLISLTAFTYDLNSLSSPVSGRTGPHPPRLQVGC